MQAFANDITENKEIKKAGMASSLTKNNEALPLFSSDEIIFPDESVDRPYTRYGYKISNFSFLVPEGTVSEIIQNQSVFTLPNSPLWIEGLINIRGNIIPVMNIDRLLKNTAIEKSTSILVLDKSDNNAAIAMLISDLPVSLEVNDNIAIPNNLPDILKNYVTDGFSKNGVDWLEFKPQGLFKKLSSKSES